MKLLTDTGYPPYVFSLDPAYWGVGFDMLDCGGNLDAPAFIPAGGLFASASGNGVLTILAHRY